MTVTAVVLSEANRGMDLVWSPLGFATPTGPTSTVT